MDATRASANMVYGKILRYTTGALRNGPRGEGGEITNQSSSPIAGDPVLSVMYFASCADPLPQFLEIINQCVLCFGQVQTRKSAQIFWNLPGLFRLFNDYSRIISSLQRPNRVSTLLAGSRAGACSPLPTRP